MKRYIHASFDRDNLDKVRAEADRILAQYDSEIDWDMTLPNVLVQGKLIKFKGKSIGSLITIDGYTAPVPHFFFDQYRSGQDVKKQIIDYLDSVQDVIDGLNVVVGRIPKAIQLAKDVAQKIRQYYINAYEDISVTASIDTGPEWADYDFIIREADGGSEYPRFNFTVTVNSMPFTEVVRWDELEQEIAFTNLISIVNKALKRASRSDSGNKLLISILKEYGIDTTKSEYELKAISYERYGNGKIYTCKFACSGDYLAYFSMAIHKQPSVRNINGWYGMDEFENIVEKYPTVEDISNYASSNWWGDGDDHIIYLKNLTTNETLYESSEFGEDSGDES